MIEVMFFNYSSGFERALFTKNDANRDNSLDLFEFSKFVSDTFDLAIFFVQYDTDRDYHLDETEYTNAEVWNSLDVRKTCEHQTISRLWPLVCPVA